MKDLSQVLSFALNDRRVLIGIAVTAVLSALLCCANFSLVYPAVEIVCRGKSIPQWLRDRAEGERQQLNEFSAPAGHVEDEPPRDHAQPAQVDSPQPSTRWEEILLLVDPWAPATAFGTLVAFCLALLAGTLLKGIVDLANARLVARMVEQTIMNLRMKVYARVLAQSPYDQTQSQGDCFNRFVGDLNNLHLDLNFIFSRSLKEPLVIIGCIIGALLISWRLVLLSALVAPISIGLLYLLGRSLRKAHHVVAERLSLVVDHLAETSAALQVVQAFGREEYEKQRFHQTALLHAQASERASVLVGSIAPVFDLLGMIGYATVVLIGGYLVLESQTHLGFLRLSERPLQLGELLLIVGLLGGIYGHARRMLGTFGRLQTAVTASQRVMEMLPPAAEDPAPSALPVENRRGAIRLENVWFSYQPGKPILKGLDLCIPFGSIVAIVGLNGSGKSTLLSLVTRFLQPDSGVISWGDVELRRFDLRQFRQQLGLVPQQTSLLKESIADNIRYGNETASREDVIEAARQAHIHDRICQLPNGYETAAGVDGQRLSGGERQRIALARALVRRPAILLLDEVTSHIDYESEQMICRALTEARETRMTILISHQPSTLAIADLVAVMDEGRIVACGDHATLLSSCEIYRKLMERSPARVQRKAA